MMDALLGDAEIQRLIGQLRPDADPNEAAAVVAWCVLTEPGDATAGTLVSELGPEAALRFALDEDGKGGSDRVRRALTEARARWRPRADARHVRDALRSATAFGVQLLLPNDASWPKPLDDLAEHAPLALWVRGNSEALKIQPAVAIVGARAATAYGDHAAAELAGDLAASGAVVVSGGAYGIDGSAHRAALGVGGTTIAFLAGGVDRAYPVGHQDLFRRIAENGAVVSEVPCGTAPTRWRFLARNRLIAALGSATVVVEAGWRSGSLNTAGHAAALGRPLGAVPGPITSAASAGCHRLLREYDARCVTSAAEVRELWGDSGVEIAPSGRDDPEQVRLIDAMSTRSARAVDDLARRSGLAPDRVTAMLGLLSLEDLVVGSGEGWRLAPANAGR